MALSFIIIAIEPQYASPRSPETNWHLRPKCVNDCQRGFKKIGDDLVLNELRGFDGCEENQTEMSRLEGWLSGCDMRKLIGVALG